MFAGYAPPSPPRIAKEMDRMDMVERVARAIAGTDYEPGGYTDQARAAIEAHTAALAEKGLVIVPVEPVKDIQLRTMGGPT